MGLGYVGAVSAACLAKDGHTVIGVDPNPTKVDLINAGKSPIVEDQVAELVAEHAGTGRLSATTDPAAAIAQTELALVCVGTPGQDNGALDMTYLERASANIGKALAGTRDFYAVVVRSTVLPGTSRSVVIPAIEKHSGKTEGIDFGVVMNPEFLREGSAVYDFYNPPKIVVGGDNDTAADMLLSLAPPTDAPVVRAPFEVAEMVKYVDNSWHALKVAFGNEIGRICDPLDIDSHAVMDIFCMDTKLNISSKYLKPGMAFGGSCLPKDVRAINYHARANDVDLPIMSGLTASNEVHLETALKMILDTGARDVTILGLSFKAGTDDLREAPMVEIAERLIGKGVRLKIYDRNVSLARLTGANEKYIHDHLPHIGQLLIDDLDRAVDGAELVVLGNSDPAFADVASVVPADLPVIDLVRVVPDPAGLTNYQGLGW
ncbi:MAG: nucleotide sugar dehydrogenase [Actinomycetota bacterium]